MNKQLRMRLLPWVIGSLFAASSAFAQNTSSSISGRIVDAAGKPVAGATVEIIHVPSGTSRTVVADENGRYNAQGLRVGGPFEVKASGDHGESADQPDVYLKLAEETTLNLTVNAAASQTLEGVTVTAIAPGATFQADNKGLSSNVSQRELKVIPNPSRSIQDIARTDPHITITNVARGEISALGQNSRYNNITIDGVPTNDSFGLEPNGLPSLNQPLSFDAIEEYNISTANYDVTNKRAVGANINIVTKAGTNEFHGDAYYAYTNAKDLTSDEPNDFKGYNAKKTYGATLGGPIIKDTLFFFLSYEESKTLAPGPTFGPIGSGATNTVNITQEQIDRITQIASDYGMTPGNLSASDANQDNKLYLAKLDWNIADGHRASFRYNKTKSDQPIIQTFNANTLSLSSYSYVQNRNLESYVLNLYDDWNDTFSTEASVSYGKYDAVSKTLADQPQVQVCIDGCASNKPSVFLGTDQFRHYNVLGVKTYNAFFAGNWFLGDHTVKAGFDFQRDKFFNLFGRTEFGAYQFSSIDDFEAGNWATYNLYRPTNGDINSVAAQWELDQWGLFAQDVWQVTPQLSLQYGLRWDIPKTGDKPPYNASFQQAFGYSNQGTIDGNSVFEPRASFNYTFDTEYKTQLRGGMGISEGMTPGVWLSNPYSNNGLSVQTFFGSNGSGFIADPYHQVPPNTAPSAQQTVDTVDKNFQLPTVLKASLAFDRELPWWGLVATAEFAHVGVRHGLWYQEINLGPGNGTLPDGRISYWRNTDPAAWAGGTTPSGYSGLQRYGSNPAFGGASTYLTNTGKGESNSLTLSLQTPFKEEGFSGGTSLTIGRATEVNPGTSSQASSNFSGRATYNPNEAIAYRSNYDVKARILGTLTWQHKFFGDYITSVSAFYDGHSGQPYSFVYGNDANGDGIANNDLLFVPKPGQVQFVNGTSQAAIDEFYAFIKGNDYLRNHQGGVTGQNGATSPWINQINLSFRQEVPGIFKDHKGELRFDIFNFGNMLNKKWGQIYDVPFASAGGFTRGIANFRGIDPATGQYIYSLPTTSDGHFNAPQFVKEDAVAQSRWSVLVTLRYTF
ncbi:TonB-dependent receptor [Dokdonella sp.]|uniref:TonB-dependent receptor n=1 Tax=Dokdonella sp. TaxID=2291710 RepID=UPI002F42F183